LVGRSPYMQAVHALAADGAVGTIREVRIDAASANSLAGTLDERIVA
jgi:tRNA-2-methylthio-N6-dimethylallyladenosine synthase